MAKRKRANGKRTRNRAKARQRRPSNKESLRAMMDEWLSDTSIFANVPRHGNTNWVPKALVCLALCWAWSEARNVTDAFDEARYTCDEMGQQRIPRTYQGFMKALVKCSHVLIAVLRVVLQQGMEKVGGRFWRTEGWLAIAFDGSRSRGPRTDSNENAFCAKNYGKGKTAKYRTKKTKGMRRRNNESNKPQPPAPQVWITLMWHMGLRLPWDWRLGPSNASERGHVMDMLTSGRFPKKTLFCGDAGFVGYAFWKTILAQRTHFLVRVGANVKLLAENADYRLLGDGGVLCWPKDQITAGEPPLRLRLVTVRIGKTKMCMLTSVLDEHLTDKQIVRLYKMRWGVEVEFRGLKQTLDRGKLRCRTSKRLLVELDWSILAMAVAELLALKAQLQDRPTNASKRRRADPNRRSLANTMRALRRCMRYVHEVPDVGNDLESLLADAVTDAYQRKSSKKARYRPPNPDKKPLGDPEVRKLDPSEKKKLREIDGKMVA